MPKVSIIMPVYNAEMYLPQALDSAIGQSFNDLEVVCVDDGSTDGSLRVLREYRDRDGRIRVVSQSNGGGSAARNTGLEAAKGEYVMFLDADDVYAEGVVDRAYSRAVNTGVDIVLYNFARFVGKPGRLAVKSRISPGRDIDFFTKETYANRFFNDFATITWNKLIKKRVIDENNLRFNEDLSHNHDVDFSIRLMLAAQSYSWLDEVGYFYRSNENGITATKRSDPTNVLRILIDLNKTIISEYSQLKRSYDNYAVDMIVGTLAKYSNSIEKQNQVFEYAHRVLIPDLNLNSDDSYLFTSEVEEFRFVENDDYGAYLKYSSNPKRRLRAKMRKLYDTAQEISSRFTV